IKAGLTLGKCSNESDKCFLWIVCAMAYRSSGFQLCCYLHHANAFLNVSASSSRKLSLPGSGGFPPIASKVSRSRLASTLAKSVCGYHWIVARPPVTAENGGLAL